MIVPEGQDAMLEAALAYAALGAPVFPCNPEDKSPRTANGFYDATTDEDQVRRWWAARPDALIGLRTGEESGIWVLDEDNGEIGRASREKLEAKHGPLPETYTVRTSGNPAKGKGPGEHRYLRYPGERVASTVSRLAPNLDVRGDGGYVIVPPSPGYSVASGAFGEFAETPGWLLQMVRDDRPSQTGDLGETYPEGRRNASLTSLAGSMRLRGAGTTAILAALNEENQTKCSPPLPWHEVVAIARSVGRYAPGSLPRTDTGNAERLVGRHGHDLMHVYGMGWLAWDGRRWRRDKTGEVERRAVDTVRSIYEEAAKVPDDEKRKALSKWAVASESVARIRAMISLAQSMPGIPVGEVNELDRDPWLLNVENGTVDLRTGVLLPHRREDLITKLAPVEHDPAAEAPTWKAFLERVMPDAETRAFLQKMVGYSLTGNVSEKTFPCLLGPGDTGKSTFVEAVLALMGEEYAQPAPEDLILAKQGTAHPTELASLLGVRFAPTVEIPEGRHLAESRVKQLTGGDKIRARFMQKDFFDFNPTHKLWLAANHEPFLKTGDDAIWNRIRKIPFDVVIPKDQQDKRLKEKFKAEMGGILNWAVEGCLAWQSEGMGEPEQVREATEAYQREQDTFSGFIEDVCVLGPEERAVTAELREAYKDWCWRSRQDPLDWKVVLGRLRDRGCITGKRVRNAAGKVKEGIFGVSLTKVELVEDGDPFTIDPGGRR